MPRRLVRMPGPDNPAIKQEFRKRQTRQIIAVAAAIFLVLLAAVVHRRPELFGEISSRSIFGVQALIIASFFGFTAVNWRCPSCGKLLGGDLHRASCAKCRARLD